MFSTLSKHKPHIKPILKWAGGKQQLLPTLLEYVPESYGKYIEPFIGGGALFFKLQPTGAIISDSNPDLINLYQTIADDVKSVISILKTLKNDEQLFYEIRSINPSTLNNAEQAARTIFLNKTCFNGLYRVNKKGQFNTPFGHYKNPTICDEENLILASELLQKNKIILGDYKSILNKYAQEGDFIYLDPPYVPISKYADFKRYTKEQFSIEDQKELGKMFDKLDDMGCKVLLSNSNHPLVHDIYSKYSIKVYTTKRNINSVANRRSGEDILVSNQNNQKVRFPNPSAIINEQMTKFPQSRYMGSKQALLKHIWEVASQFTFNSVLDLFGGSNSVGYMFKAQGKQVISNDYMAFSYHNAKALIENNSIVLTQDDINLLLENNPIEDYFVSNTFKDLYFCDKDNNFIDLFRNNIKNLKCETKKSIAYSALARACIKKRPRGIFTYTGHRYDDGRKDLNLTLEQHFINAVELLNEAVFDNDRVNLALNSDSTLCDVTADLVYIDPPYYSPLSDNEYVRRYHFVEGLVKDWKNVEMQWNTKTKKFKNYPTPFNTQKGAYDAFELLFDKHSKSIIIVSYSSNSLPTKEELTRLLKKYKRNVEVIELDHRYSFGNQSSNDIIKNNVTEYLFIGY